MSPTHRVSVRVPTEIFNKFRKFYPYRGELTAFIVRALETEVIKKMRGELQYGKIDRGNRPSALGDVYGGPDSPCLNAGKRESQQGVKPFKFPKIPQTWCEKQDESKEKE